MSILVTPCLSWKYSVLVVMDVQCWAIEARGAVYQLLQISCDGADQAAEAGLSEKKAAPSWILEEFGY